LAQAFKNSSKPYHLFVISSTVMPGSTNESFIPILEKYSGRKLHTDFDVCFDPDFVALGKVIKDFLNPDLVVIGETSQEAGQRVEAIHRQMCENKPQISHMSIINAEIAKVSLNAYVTLKISFANSLANLCERVPGADVDSITQAIGADKRISPQYFRGGLGFGGTCFPRDTKAFISLAERYGSPSDLVQATAHVNSYQERHLSEIVLREANRMIDGRIGVLGLAFTLNTPVIAESPSVKLIHELIMGGKHVVVFDPLALDNASAVFGDVIKYASSVEECLEKSEIWVVTNRLQDYKLAIESHKPGRSIVVIDCWRNIDPSRLDKEIDYIPFGRYIATIH
jgi:UDPglucose 6-dehydrogenase